MFRGEKSSGGLIPTKYIGSELALRPIKQMLNSIWLEIIDGVNLEANEWLKGAPVSAGRLHVLFHVPVSGMYVPGSAAKNLGTFPVQADEG